MTSPPKAVFLLHLAALLGCRAASLVATRKSSSEATAPSPQVIPWNDGERLLLGRRRAPLTIKVSPRTGSSTLLMGTEDIRAGDGIPVHMHMNEDEILFIHGGKGVVTVGDHEDPVDTGTTIYVPRGTWHGVRNEREASTPIQLLWIFSAPGMDDYFRVGSAAAFSPRSRSFIAPSPA